LLGVGFLFFKKEKQKIPEKETFETAGPSLEKENFSLPEIFISSLSPSQGDTLLIKIYNGAKIEKIDGYFGREKINFFQTGKDLTALIGIDVKIKPGKLNLIINFSNGRQFEKELNIIESKFPVTELLVTKELEKRGFTVSKIVEEIVAKENLILREIVSLYTPRAYFDKAFTFPLEKIKNVGPFGNIRKSGQLTLQHLGVDLEAEIGTPVFAINNGVVRLAREFFNYGKTIVIDHGLGIFSLYLHLDEIKVFEGKEVKKGKIIALSGNTGYSIEPHLHFSLKINEASVDPLKFIEITNQHLEQ